MKKRNQIICGAVAAVCLIWSLTGCGQRVDNAVQSEAPPVSASSENTTPETQAAVPVTEKTTEAAPAQSEKKEAESETQKLITSVDYTSKDGSVKITLPDNTWKVTQDADEMRVFQSGNDAIVNIVHADTPTAMTNLNVSTSEQELEESLSRQQYASEKPFEIMDFTSAVSNNINIYRYTVRFTDPARMWAYSVTNAVLAEDEAYVVTGTVTDDNRTLMDSVKKAVESFQVLSDPELKAATGEVLTGTSAAQMMTEKINTNTVSTQEMGSETNYGTAATLVTVDAVNVRSAPGTDSDVLITLDGSTPVSVVGETANWFKVSINGSVGYIRKDCLVYGDGSPATTVNPQQPVDTGVQANAELGTATNYGTSSTLYASSEVNIRTAPGTDSNVINSIPQGTSVTVVGETDNWYIVDMGGTTGYISKEFLAADQGGGQTVWQEDPQQPAVTPGEDTPADPGTTTTPTTPSAVSGTVVGSTVDSITIAGDDGNTYTVYYGDASVTSADGIYDGVYVNVSLDASQTTEDGSLYATGVTGY